MTFLESWAAHDAVNPTLLGLFLVMAVLCIWAARATRDAPLALLGVGFALYGGQYLLDWVNTPAWEPVTDSLRFALRTGGLAFIFVGLLTHFRGNTLSLKQDGLLAGVASFVAAVALTASQGNTLVGAGLAAGLFSYASARGWKAGRIRPGRGHRIVAALTAIVSAAVLLGLVMRLSASQLRGSSPFMLLVLGQVMLVVALRNARLDSQGQLSQTQAAQDKASELSGLLKRQVDALNDVNSRLSVVLNASGFKVWEADIGTGALTGGRGPAGTPAGMTYSSVYAMFDNMLEADAVRVRRLWEELRTGRRREFSAEYSMADPLCRRMLVTHAELIELSGRSMVVGATRDITDAVANREAEHARRRAERASQVKSEFMSMLSHELRTPLNAVLGFGQLIADDSANGETARESAAHIVTAGTHMLELVSQVLELACLESGTVVVESSPVRVEEVVSQSLSMSAGAAASRGLRLSALPIPVELAVYANEMRIRQILLNLLSNAVKYNRERGEIEVGATWSDAEVSIWVKDTGEGLTLEQQGRLFVAFERLGHKRSGVAGHGLGLAVSRQLAHAMGGQLTVTSEKGRGSTFRLTLPRSVDMSAPPLPAPVVEVMPPAPRPVGSNEVVYVEDNDANVALMRKLFAKRKHLHLHHARTVAEGKSLCDALSPKLILVDLMLEGERGEDLLRLLREANFTGAIIAVSANAMAADRARALRDGFDAFWPKPLALKTCLQDLDVWAPVVTGESPAQGESGGPAPA